MSYYPECSSCGDSGWKWVEATGGSADRVQCHCVPEQIVTPIRTDEENSDES